MNFYKEKFMELWIARDKYDDLWMFENMPILCRDECWCDSKNGNFMLLDKTLFPDVTFENSPQKIELKLKGE